MFFHKYRSHEDRISNRRGKFVGRTQKILLSMLLAAGIGANITYSTSAKTEELSTVYHIYSEDEYIGALSDESKLEQVKEEKLEQTASKFDNLPLSIKENYSVVPERVFTVGTNDQAVIEELQELLAVEAEAVAVMVDEEPALYVHDQEAYEEVIRKLKLQSMTEEELVDFEAREKATATAAVPPLKENETRVVDIFMSANLEAKDGKVAPQEILSVDEAIVLLNKGTLEEKKYTVQAGDVVGKIANKHGMATAELFEINPELTEKTIIRPGDELNVTMLEPYVEVQVHFETKKRKNISYKKVTEEDNSLYKGEKKIKQKGAQGEKIVTERIRKMDGQVLGKSVKEEEIVVEPKNEVTVIGTKEMPSRGVGSFQWPTVGGYVSSPMGARWGRMHRGIDIARPSARTILASDNGVVTAVGWDGSYGNRIIVNHNNGYQTLYAHLASMDVKVGQTVAQGQKIGVMGTTGHSTGIHLHFEVTKNGTLIDPLTVLNK